MKDFENLTTEEQTNVIMEIGSKLTGQEIWYWEGIVHLLREQDKEIQRLNNIITEYEKWLLETAKKQEFWEQREIYKSCFNKLDKLKELKGEDKE